MNGLKKPRRNTKRKTRRNLRKNTRRHRNNNKTKQRIFYGKGQSQSLPPPPNQKEPTDKQNDESFLINVWYNAHYEILADDMEKFQATATAIENRQKKEKANPGSGYNRDGSYKN
jgi:hypothetical protein